MKMYILLTKADESIEMIDAGTFQTMRFGNQDYYVVPIPKREMPKAPVVTPADEPTKRKYVKSGKFYDKNKPSEVYPKVRDAVMEEIVEKGGLYPEEMSRIIKQYTPHPSIFLATLLRTRVVKKDPLGKWTLF